MMLDHNRSFPLPSFQWKLIASSYQSLPSLPPGLSPSAPPSPFPYPTFAPPSLPNRLPPVFNPQEAVIRLLPLPLPLPLPLLASPLLPGSLAFTFRPPAASVRHRNLHSWTPRNFVQPFTPFSVPTHCIASVPFVLLVHVVLSFGIPPFRWTIRSPSSPLTKTVLAVQFTSWCPFACAQTHTLPFPFRTITHPTPMSLRGSLCSVTCTLLNALRARPSVISRLISITCPPALHPQRRHSKGNSFAPDVSRGGG